MSSCSKTKREICLLPGLSPACPGPENQRLSLLILEPNFIVIEQTMWASLGVKPLLEQFTFGKMPCLNEMCPKDITVEQKLLILNSVTFYSESQLVVVHEILSKYSTLLSFGFSFVKWS